MGTSSSEPVPVRWRQPGEEAVAGLYWVGEDGTPHASWHSSLPGGPRSLFASRAIPLLHGDAMGKAVTLTGVHLKSVQSPMRGETSRTEATATLAFEGDLLLTTDEMEFDRVRFHLRDLTSWAQWNSWRDLDASRPSMPRIEHQGDVRREIAHDGSLVAIEDAGSFEQRHGNWSLTNDCRVDLKLRSPISLDDIDYYWLRPAQLLITSATGRECHLHHLSLSRSEWLAGQVEGVKDMRGRSAWLTVRARRVDREDSYEPLSHLHLLHRMRDLREDQVTSFLQASLHHRYALERYSDSVSGRGASPESAFAEAVQAVEALDAGLHMDGPDPWQKQTANVVDEILRANGLNSAQRRSAVRGLQLAHVKPLSARLRRLDNETGGKITTCTGLESWAEDIQAIRNAVVHGRTGPAFREVGAALAIGRSICQLIFERRWLGVMGHDTESTDRLFMRKAYQQNTLDWIAAHADRLSEASARLKGSQQL